MLKRSQLRKYVKYFSGLCLLALLIAIYSHLTQFRSYEHVNVIDPLIAQKCAQYAKKPATDLTEFESGVVRRVGFFLMGTGKYIKLTDQLITSMETHFCTDPRMPVYVHYFIITDEKSYSPQLASNSKLHRRNYSLIYQKQMEWPYSTLLRFEIIVKNFGELGFNTFDYLYWLDGDMKMVAPVCEDIFGDLVATMHPHYYMSDHAYPYESSNAKSRAYVDQRHRYENRYYVGAFFGGSPHEMCMLLMTCHQNIQYDYNTLDGFIARVHDESHLNRLGKNIHYFD